jgi:HEAT repeat protein
MLMRREAVVAALFLVGCISDPRDPKTWIKKLDDPRDKDEAVIQLVKLKDPAAVPALIDLYKKTKDPVHLKAIATFKDKRALDVMIDSLDYTEDSFDAAAAAATGLGDIPDAKAVDPLIKALSKPLPVKTRANIVKMESMKALVKIHDPKAVDALVKVLETSADDQDFFLNHEAASYLGAFGDARAVPALVRGLFMTGRGSDIFQPCRVSLLQIGKPAVQPLIEAMQRKNAKLEADAKAGEFRTGVVVQKTALMLGDLRAKEAVPALLGELKKPPQGDSYKGVLYALGMIGDKSTTKDIVAVLTNAKADAQNRVTAAESLNLMGDPSALPALLTMAKSGFAMVNGEKFDDVRVASAMAYGRVGGAADYAGFAAATAAEKVAADVFKESLQRLEVAKECKDNVGCYAKALDDKVLVKEEKAAFMLARMSGKDGLDALAKHVSTKEPLIRMAVLFALGKQGDKSCDACKKALEAQIDIDKTKPPLRPIVEEMRAVQAEILNK